MLKKISCSSIIVLLSVTFLWAGYDPEQIQDYSKAITQVKLSVPDDPDVKAYLGIKQKSGQVMLNDIDGEIIIIEIFSMYCPYCQKDAPGVNELFRLIENNPDIKNKIKLIGIGAGNSSYEVEVFKKTYTVPFPLFPDKDFTIHKVCGEVRTPYFMVVKINDDGTHQIVHSQLGNYPGAEPFLDLVLKASGLK